MNSVSVHSPGKNGMLHIIKPFRLELGSKTSLVSGGRVFNWLFNCRSAECHSFIFILQLADCRLSRWPDEVPHETVPKLTQFS